MAELPEWKKALQEPHALGWIGLIVLVIVIGICALYFGDSRHLDPAPISSIAHKNGP